MCQRCTRVLLNFCWVCWSGTEMFLTFIVFSAGNTVGNIEQSVSTLGASRQCRKSPDPQRSESFYLTRLRQKYFFEKKLRNSDQIDSNTFRKISHKTVGKVIC